MKFEVAFVRIYLWVYLNAKEVFYEGSSFFMCIHDNNACSRCPMARVHDYSRRLRRD
jgi:hypothetical protein